MNENKKDKIEVDYIELHLDVVPFYKNKKLPDIHDFWHYETERIELKGKIIDLQERKRHEEIHIEKMKHDIINKFCDADAIVILRDGMIIDIIGKQMKINQNTYLAYRNIKWALYRNDLGSITKDDIQTLYDCINGVNKNDK